MPRKLGTCKIYIILAGLVILSLANSGHAFSITFDPACIGKVINAESGHIIGTGFVAGAHNRVITAAHVAVAGRYLYKDITQTDITHILKSEHSLPDYDLSVFSTSGEACKDPLKFGNFRRMHPGDRIIYLGWKAEINKMQANTTIVSAVGSAINGKIIADFLEFEGVGKPGFSGGPVFDKDENVIAVMREGWAKSDLLHGPTVLINRAFSTDPLYILQEQIFPGAAIAVLDCIYGNTVLGSWV